MTIKLILLGDNKMMHYSPMSRYTAQRIADKVGNGAYFYSHFSVDGENHLQYPKIQKLIDKLSQKYHLKLTARQRTYKLNTKKEPIADLVVQKRLNSDIFDFWLLITTPNSHRYNLAKVEVALKDEKSKQKIAEVEEMDWDCAQEKNEILMIQEYFQDKEKFKFVLQKPFLALNFAKGKWVELVRLSHSKKNAKKYAATEKSAKNYTWTWRYDDSTVAMISTKYKEIMNDLVSNPNLAVGMNKLQALNTDLQHYTVFKGNRHQVGQLFVDAVRYHFKKKGSDFRQAEYYLPLRLNYLPRQAIYAKDCFQYIILRRLFEETGREFGQENVHEETYNQLINQYLI
jgi:hypothetical protein